MDEYVLVGGPSGGMKGMGWLPDYPDFRDFTPESEEIKPILDKTSAPGLDSEALPEAVDLGEWCSPIEDQGRIGSCTAHAGVGMVEYFERKAHGKHIDGSRRFLYKVTRELGRFRGDSGAFLRTTMGAMVFFGVPPEDYWPYDEAKFDEEPPQFCYALAQSYQAVTGKYYRLDTPQTSREELLRRIKAHLASNLPSMFGFTVYESIDQAHGNGKIPYPASQDKIAGGHAVMAVGYDDKLAIGNERDGGGTEGAVRIRNSWGRGWGEEGYGWLPYAYIERELANDWWILLEGEWVDTGEFKL